MGILNNDKNDTSPLAVDVHSCSSLMAKEKGQERISIPSLCGSLLSTTVSLSLSSSSVSTTTSTTTTGLSSASSLTSIKSTASTLVSTLTSTSTSSLLSSLHSSRNSSSSSLSSFLTSITSVTAPATTARTTSAIATQPTTTETVEKILPPVIWFELIIPLLDRQGWNALLGASKHIYLLVQLTNIPNSSYSKAIAQPPWPTNYCFAPTGSSSQQAMDSFTLSYDGDYLACGSAIGTIELWNRRTGKVRLRKAPSTSLTGNNSSRVRVSRSHKEEEQEQQGSITPVGNILKFSPIDYTLACGHENRIVLWDISKINSLSKAKAKATGGTSTTTRQHHHYLPTPSVLPTYSNNLKQHHQQQQSQQQESSAVDEESYTQTVEINCHRQGSNLYEITYINFSQDASKLLARYGKMAYLWTQTKTQSYQLTHQIELTSSRCQIVSNPSLSFLAVASNNGSATTATTNNNTNTSSRDGGGSAGYTANNDAAAVNSNDSSSNNNINSTDCNRTSVRTTITGKGIIDVWDLSTTTVVTNDVDNGDDDNDNDIPKQHPYGSTKIIAYPKHVIRGLEFISSSSSWLSSNNNNNNINNSNRNNSCCLVSGSLQGELKFWFIQNKSKGNKRKYYTYGNSNNNNNKKPQDDNDNDDNKLEYICLYSFQSPGKIFSLSSWSSNNKSSLLSSMISSSSSYQNNNSTDDDGDCDIYLAAGEARGQIRIWNVNVTRKQYHHQQGERNHEQREQERECNYEQSSKIGNSDSDSGGSSSLLFPRRHRPVIRLQEVLVKEVGEHVHYDNLKLVSFVPSSSLSNNHHDHNDHNHNAIGTCSPDNKDENQQNTAAINYYYNYYAGNNGNDKNSSKYSNQYSYTPPSQPPRSIAVSRSYDSRIYFQSIPF